MGSSARKGGRTRGYARNIVVANNPYLAEEVLWQTGHRVPTLRIHGLHTDATYRNGPRLASAARGTIGGGWPGPSSLPSRHPRSSILVR
eukprot:2004060-Pyramimonas_sp.AAC.1